MTNKTCPKCSGRMENGALTSIEGPHRIRLKWLKGIIKKGFWGGETVKSSKGEIDVIHYSCQKCGYIESYVER